MYVWPTLCTAVMFTAFLDCCFVVVLLVSCFRSKFGVCKRCSQTHLCTNFCFENNVTPCLNQKTITYLHLQLTLLEICKDVIFPQ
jgi:hypothetical protein